MTSAGPTVAAKAQDFEDFPSCDDAKKPKMVRQSSRCTKCTIMSLLGLQSEPASVDPKSPKSPKKMPESPKKAPATPKAKIGRRNVEVTASDGIDIAKVVESKPFQELIDSLANKKSFEALQIKILSVVEQPRIENCDYIVVRPDLPVCETMKRNSDKVATLPIDTVVKVLEIHEEDEDGRVRARIESPAGWISTSHHKGTIYAKPREAASDITYIECMVDAKIDGKLAPGTLFVRGSAVAALVVLHVDAEKRSYALLVKQDGVPDSLAAIGEIPAGTFDSDGSFTGALAKEILEKVGIEIKQSDLVDVTEATYKEGTPSIFPSCGAKIFEKVLVLQEHTTAEDLKKLEESLGEASDGGLKLYLEPLENDPEKQAHPVVGLYERLITSGALNEISKVEWHFNKKVKAIGEFFNSFS